MGESKVDVQIVLFISIRVGLLWVSYMISCLAVDTQYSVLLGGTSTLSKIISLLRKWKAPR